MTRKENHSYYGVGKEEGQDCVGDLKWIRMLECSEQVTLWIVIQDHDEWKGLLSEAKSQMNFQANDDEFLNLYLAYSITLFVMLYAYFSLRTV